MCGLEGNEKMDGAENCLLRPMDTFDTNSIKSSFKKKSTFSHHSKQDSGGLFLTGVYIIMTNSHQKRAITNL